MRALVGMTVVMLGCGPAVKLDTPADEGSSSEATASTATSSGLSTTDADPTTPPLPSETGSAPPLPGSSGGSSGGSDSTSGDDGFPDPLPPTRGCAKDEECASGHCYVTPLGGACGECSGDADCDFGCNLPNLLATPPEGSTCGDGSVGQNCETADACDELECRVVLDISGLLQVSCCSECAVDADCQPGRVCDVDVSVADLSGAWTCTPIGTEPLGASCAVDSAGDAACASGHCASADFAGGLVQVGVCSECSQDMDCLPGQSCVPPLTGFEGTTPGFCE